MKTIIVASIFLMFGCATSLDMQPKSTTETLVEVEKPQSFAYCMRWNEDIVLTAMEEVALFEYCGELFL
jgi:hypothetical protein